jgi:hypothetical protein
LGRYHTCGKLGYRIWNFSWSGFGKLISLSILEIVNFHLPQFSDKLPKNLIFVMTLCDTVYFICFLGLELTLGATKKCIRHFIRPWEGLSIWP